MEDFLTLRHSFSREDLALRFYENLRLNNEMPKALLSLSTATWEARIIKQSVASLTSAGRVEGMRAEMERDGIKVVGE